MSKLSDNTIDADTKKRLLAKNFMDGSINPDTFTYSQMKQVIKVYGHTVKEFAKGIGSDIDTPRKNAERNNGFIGRRYFYMVMGWIKIQQLKNNNVESLNHLR